MSAIEASPNQIRVCGESPESAFSVDDDRIEATGPEPNGRKYRVNVDQQELADPWTT